MLRGLAPRARPSRGGQWSPARGGAYSPGQATGVPPLLDEFPGALFAYSLRDLNGTGAAVVRGQLSAGGTQRDFTADEILDGTLSDFAAGGLCYCKTIYDQSGNGNDLTTSTATQMPKLTDGSGVPYVLSENGLPFVYFSGASDYLDVTGLSDSVSPLSTVAVYERGSDVNYAIQCQVATGVSNGFAHIQSSVNQWQQLEGSNSLSSAKTNDSLELHFLLWRSAANQWHRNGSQVATSASSHSATASGFAIGAGVGGASAGAGSPKLRWQEWAGWAADKSSEQTAITDNAKSYHSVF